VRAALNLMVLATVPTLRDAAAPRWRFRRAAAISAGAVIVLAVCATAFLKAAAYISALGILR
jgi:hypothetical protein